MSLINKMLQDLDARGGDQAAPGLGHAQIRSVSMAGRLRASLNARMLVSAALCLLFIAAGFYAWKRQAASNAVYTARTPANRIAPSRPGPVLQAAPAAEPAAAAPAPALAAAPHEDDPSPALQEPLTQSLDMKMAPELGGKPLSTFRPRAAAKQAPQPAPAKLAKGRESAHEAVGAEAEYRAATALLQQGRVTEAIAALERAVATDPQHQPARQTLIGLLVEAGRNDQAMRHLRDSLAMDAAQPELAMLQARLMMDGGDLRSAIVTLYRSAPSAAAKPEYQAFLAELLRRDKRYKQAAERYSAALRTNPQNAVWWMGLGISLQADQRPREAHEAYLRARQTGTLSPELTGFVEQRMLQTAH
jgi:MSHA biogenesis protein MshN